MICMAACVHAQLCPTLWDPLLTVARQAPLSMGFSQQDPGVNCNFLLQGIEPTQVYALLLRHLGSTCMAELATEILTVVIPKKCPVPELQLQ